MSVDEMRAFLLKEYGIKSDKDLIKELEKLGGINIGIFVSPKEPKETGCKKTA